MKKIKKKKKVTKVTKVSKIEFYHGVVIADIKAAKKAGLTKIDEALYTLIKTGSKNVSPLGYKDQFIALERANIYMITNEGYAFIVAFKDANYFKTSPVLSTKKKGKDYFIETENSFYKLERT